MRIELEKQDIPLVERFSDEGWKVRWDIRETTDKEGNGTGKWTCEEETVNYPPSLDDIKGMVADWQDKQTDGAIRHGYVWNEKKVLLSDENRANFKAVFDLAVMVEPQLQAWDAAHPLLAGQQYTLEEAKMPDGTPMLDEAGVPIMVQVPTGRPKAVLPTTFKLGDREDPNFHTFTTLEELTDFYTGGMTHVSSCYESGWVKGSTFDFAPYEAALEALG